LTARRPEQLKKLSVGGKSKRSGIFLESIRISIPFGLLARYPFHLRPVPALHLMMLVRGKGLESLLDGGKSERPSQWESRRSLRILMQKTRNNDVKLTWNARSELELNMPKRSSKIRAAQHALTVRNQGLLVPSVTESESARPVKTISLQDNIALPVGEPDSAQNATDNRLQERPVTCVIGKPTRRMPLGNIGTPHVQSVMENPSPEQPAPIAGRKDLIFSARYVLGNRTSAKHV
jgi:hypothetical protein